MPVKQGKNKKASVGINQRPIVHITSPRNSTSYSESTRYVSTYQLDIKFASEYPFVFGISRWLNFCEE